MPLQPGRKLPALFLILFSLLAGFAFTYSVGTTDVGIWQGWNNQAVAHGLVAGYTNIHADYPPLASTILFVANQVLQPLRLSSFLGIKLSILFFLLLTTFLLWLWTRDLKVTLILYFALLLDSVALGYIDVFFAPGLVLALWMLKERRWLWFSLFFTLTCLTKWQPIIIAPFLLLYVLGIQEIRQWRQVDWKSLLLTIGLPAATLLGLALVVFGVQPVWLAFRASLSHEYISGNALNLNWIITHFLHVSDPNQFGGLRNGQADYIMTNSLRITLVPRLLFFISYLAALVLFLRREKTFPNLLIFATLGFLCYYTFNTGVHENHLFLVAILAAVLYWLEESWRVIAVILMLMNDINLYLFYGVNGELPYPRLFAGVDVALPLAALNVLFLIYMFGMVIASSLPVPAKEMAAEPLS